jgi:lysine-specific demethylase/histidyl-hydroxylase NO66
METHSDRSYAALADLVAPVSPAAFMAKYWEARPLHIARPAPSWCRDFPGVADIDSLLARADAGDIRLVRTMNGGGTESHVGKNGNGRPDLAAIYRAYGDRWTVVVNHVHEKSPTVGRLAANLEEALRHWVGVNLYFTPPRAQGFAPHADGHDVFVLQLAGRKQWRVFRPIVPLPLEGQKVEVDRARLGRCLLELVLEPGHVLYMPRGFIHAGVADAEASVHLTIGVHPFRWLDLVHEAVGVASERKVALRRSVPMDVRQGAPRAAEFERRLRVVLSALRHSDVAGEAWQRLRQRRTEKSHAAPDGHFVAIDRARSIGLQTVLERRRGLRCLVRIAGGRARLEFGENRVDGPVTIEPALRFIARHDRFSVAELPDDLTDGSKVVLARRLVLEGLLTVDGASTAKENTRWQRRKRRRKR